jgi:uncharacterized membrane protein YfcA
MIALIVIFVLTSAVSVVTGSTSLITVPALLMFGVEPRTALATNMFALTFMSAGGALPFIRDGSIDRRRLPLLVALTMIGSAIGALLVLIIPARTLPLIISISMLAVAVFTLTYRNAGVIPTEGAPSRAAEAAGYAATFALGIYGGFFSGGYVTLLTAAYVALFGMTFVEAIGITKLINIFSSLVATLVFMWQGLIDYRLGLILGAAMFMGAVAGGRLTMRLSNLWLRRIFLAAVIALALKSLLYDLLWKSFR